MRLDSEPSGVVGHCFGSVVVVVVGLDSKTWLETRQTCLEPLSSVLVAGSGSSSSTKL